MLSRTTSATFAALVLATCANAQFTYTITDLGSPGDYESVAYDINNSGQVVGGFLDNVNLDYHAFSYSSGTGRTDLGTLGGTYSWAYANNDSGQVVGDSNDSNDDYNAFLYSSGTGMTNIGVDHAAFDINASGQVVGTNYFTGSAALYDGVIWNDLGTLGGAFSDAFGINDSGDIVGSSLTDGNLTYHAFLYSGGIMSDLGTLNPTYDYSEAFGINASGDIVGFSSFDDFNDHAFLYDGSDMIDLGVFFNWSEAYDINDSGQVVGTSDDLAFLYNGSGLIDLNSVVDFSGSNFLSLSAANGINNSGQIVGYGYDGDGFARAFLLTPINLSPVPEPSTYAAICGVGLLALAGARLRQRRLAAQPTPTATS